MASTITEKILARHAGLKMVEPGQSIWVEADVLMTHDVCGPGTIGIFEEEFGRGAPVFDPAKVILIPDHYIFTADEKARRNVDILRDFARKQGIVHFYDVGTEVYKGVCHVALAEEGHTRPGEVLFGTDSHSPTAGAFGEFATGIGNTEAGFLLGTGRLWLRVPPTMRFILEGEPPPYLMAKDIILWIIGEIGVDGASYRAMEFAGDGVARLGMDERMTLCNMVIEAGGKNGIIAPDDTTRRFVDEGNRGGVAYECVYGDEGAAFHSERAVPLRELEPVVATPHSPANRRSARELRDVRIDRAYIGSCTGGKVTDLVRAAGILRRGPVKVKTFVVPATTEVERALDREKIDGKTLRQIFEGAGARIGRPSCAACLGGPHDTFGRVNEPERCVSTTNRNFPGRMGSKDAEVFLASPLTVSASALTGRITDPREVP